MKSLRWFGAILLAALCFAALATAQVSSQTPPPSTGRSDLGTLDLESLLSTKVITASKFSENLADAPGVISVISQDELRRFGGLTLQEVLERVPGLSLTTSYFTDRSMVVARGDQTKPNGSHILFLINGRPTREVMEGGLISDLMEAFPINALEKIEIIKGPGSVLYGSNAFSAVINLITKKAEHNGLALSGFGGENGVKGNFGQVMIQRGSFNLFGAGQFHQNPDWNLDYRMPPSLVGYPAAPVVPALQNVTLEDRSAGAYLGANYKNLTFTSSYTEWRAPSFVRGTVARNTWRRAFSDLGYTAKPNDHWDMNFNATYTRNTLDNYAFPTIGRDSYELVFEWTNFVELGYRDRLTFGTLFNYIEGTETYFGLGFPIDISNGTRPGGAFYGQLDHQLSDAVKLVGGFQANKVEGTGMNVAPRAGVIWNPTSHFSAKALYSGAFRAPSLDETHLNHPGLAGTPGLLPEKVGTLDLSVSYQANRSQATLTFFRSRLTDSIVGVLPFGQARYVYANAGETTIHGFELEGKHYLGKNFYLTGSISYQADEDASAANPIPVPAVTAKAGFSYRAENGLTIGMFDNYQGALRTIPDAVNPGPVAFHLISTHVRYDLSRFLGSSDKAGVALFAHAENLANHQIWLPDLGDNSGDTLPVNRGRTVYFGLEFSLGKE